MKRTKQAAPTPQPKVKHPWKTNKPKPKLTPAERTVRMNKLTKARQHFTKKESVDINEFWKAKSTYGRQPTFKTPKELMDACMQYFSWVETHPFYEFKVVGTHFGETITENIPKKRPMTIVSLCLFLDISVVTWLNYKKKGDQFLNICNMAEDVIREQKFGGAASGFFNHSIIARDLGLVDKKDVTSAGEAIQGGTTIINKLDLSGLTTVELKTLEGLATKLFSTNKVDFEEGDQN